MKSVGEKMYSWAKDLFPICRSITGDGTRETLQYLRNLLPALNLTEVPSGTAAFDWTVPDEWNIRDAFVADAHGNRVIDFKTSNLHVVGYSEPVDRWVELDELQQHLYSLEDRPDTIPYITSYYKRRWGFCLAHNHRRKLLPGKYHVVVDSALEPGSLTYADMVLPGSSSREVLFSTYVCHPSMANNELSGPVVTAALAQWLSELPERRFTYRFVFIPETIGSIVYLSRHAREMKERTVAGFVVTCAGDDRCFSFMPSRLGRTLADRVALHVLRHHAPDFRTYTFLERGSDERQYCSPKIDLPVVSIMRSKYGDYPEYHTSDDDLSLISPQGLQGTFDMLQRCVRALEANRTFDATFCCEPQLGKRGLYPTLSTRETAAKVRTMMNVLGYADGRTDLLGIAELIGQPFEKCAEVAKLLTDAGVLEIRD
ncbi:MAG TPA: DUF4910 domain-containing protein [Terriglobales bacterium]|nr:DUF4910 domain-containing protein [Terriglobales bacterium]